MMTRVEIPAQQYAAYLALLEPAFLKQESYGPRGRPLGPLTAKLGRALTAKERSRVAYEKIKQAKADPKKDPKQYDRFVYGVIRRSTQISGPALQKKLKCTPGIMAGSLKRLKDAQWIVYLPGTEVYMTASNYKMRISDGVTE